MHNCLIITDSLSGRTSCNVLFGCFLRYGKSVGDTLPCSKLLLCFNATFIAWTSSKRTSNVKISENARLASLCIIFYVKNDRREGAYALSRAEVDCKTNSTKSAAHAIAPQVECFPSPFAPSFHRKYCVSCIDK